MKLKLLLLAFLILTGIASAQVCTGGPYTITSQPPSNCPFYGQNTLSVTNKILPANVMSHLAVNSDAMAQGAFNAGGTANGFTYPTIWASPGTDDNGNPLFYSPPTAPYYKFNASCTQTTGIQNAPAFRAPNNAPFNDTHRSDSSSSFFSDANIRIFDPSTNTIVGNYQANNSITPHTIGSCGATSPGAACTFVGGGACGQSSPNVFTSQDWGTPDGWNQRSGNEGSSGFAPMAGIVRSKELTDGVINHALILGLSCTGAYNGGLNHVFPSTLDTAHCQNTTPSEANNPPNGALFFLDYTPAQIAAMGLPNGPQKTILTTLSTYGGYIDVTAGGSAVGIIVFHESPMAYQLQTGGTLTTRTTGGGVTGMYVTGGTPDPAMAYLNGTVGCGSTSGTSDCKYNILLWNGIPLVNGTDVTHHMHIADPCVALGYAGQPGGCASSPVSTLSVVPTSFSYGNVQTGVPVNHTFVVTNSAVATVVVSSAPVTGAGFALASNGCGSLAPNASCNIVVTASPTVTGAMSGMLTINSNASNSVISVPLSGTGTQPTITINPPRIVFSPVTIGATGTIPQGFTDLFNTGTLNSTLWAIDTGSAPGNIAGVNNGTLSAANVDLSQGQLGMRVTQGISGGLATSVGSEVRTQATYGFGTYTCKLRSASTATTPGGAGSVTSGQISSCFEFINNSLTEIDQPEIEGQSPNLLEWTNFVNGAGNSQFTSTTPGFAPDQSSHTYGAAWSPNQIIFSVDGTPVSTHALNVPIAPTFALFNLWGTNSTSFGGPAVAGTRWMYISNFTYTPLSNEVFIYNTGSAPMTFTSVPAVSGPFTSTTTCPVSPTTLAVNASCKVTVTFVPTLTGVSTGTLTIASNSAGGTQLIPLSGTGNPSIVAPGGFLMQQAVLGVH